MIKYRKWISWTSWKYIADLVEKKLDQMLNLSKMRCRTNKDGLEKSWACSSGIFLFCRTGQIYNGEIGKGVLLMVVQVINIFLCFVGIGLITYPVTWIYGMWDAYKTAEKINVKVTENMFSLSDSV